MKELVQKHESIDQVYTEQIKLLKPDKGNSPTNMSQSVKKYMKRLQLLQYRYAFSNRRKLRKHSN